MPRLLFTKTGEAIWMSHLDLMRLFQRAFKRAGLNLKHTQGYNPRPSVSIALPLSVGVESLCELLDFDLEGESVSCCEITERLNGALVPGVQVLQTYDDGRKIKDLSLLSCRIIMQYDGVVPEEAIDYIGTLFRREALTVEKKGKNGPTQQDIIPMMSDVELAAQGEGELVIHVTVCAQNPTLNPQQIVAAIETFLPECKPDFAVIRRLETLYPDGGVFR